MKHAKKLLSFVLAALMVFSMCGTAFAADDKCKISVPEDDKHIYEVYQIFTGSVDKDADGKTILENIKWGKNGLQPDAAVSKEILEELESLVGKGDSEILEVIEKNEYFNNGSEPVSDNLSTGNPYEGAPGYYLIKQTKLEGDNDTYTKYIVQVFGDLTIQRKASKVPTVEKKVKDVNDSTGDKSEWQDSADYDIGDTIPYQLTGTIPEGIDKYKAYYYSFNDDLSDFLSLDESTVKVTLYDENNTPHDVTSSFKRSSTSESKYGGSTFKIACQDIISVAAAQKVTLNEKCKIVVNYSAELKADAVIGEEGNPNDVTLTYSTNPNWNGEGTPDTDTTKPDKVIVFTYELIVNKFNDHMESLAGAEFTLQKYDAEAKDFKDYEQNGSVVKAIVNEDGEVKVTMGDQTYTMVEGSQFTFKGLDDGQYQLVESHTPDGYNTIDPLKFDIVATHEEKSDNPKLLSLTAKNEKGEVTEALNDNGEDVKTYKNTEFDVNRAEGEVLLGVVNVPGSLLPTTGGMGTTLFHVVGLALVLGAGALLIARKRMGAEQ